jgi:putative Mg2+ transporter-C (MgtC) family protein
VIKLLSAGILGGIIGYEQNRNQRHPGLRLLLLICVVTTAFTVGALKLGNIADVGDPGNAAAGIIAALGLFGSALLFKSDDTEDGILSAVLLWSVGGVGFLVGTGQILVAVVLTGIIYYILRYLPGIIQKEMQSLDDEYTKAE